MRRIIWDATPTNCARFCQAILCPVEGQLPLDVFDPATRGRLPAFVQLVEWHQPRARRPSADVVTGIDDQAMEPRCERSPDVDTPEVAVEPEERLLGHILREIQPAEQTQRGPENHALVAQDEVLEGPAVTRSRTLDEGSFRPIHRLGTNVRITMRQGELFRSRRCHGAALWIRPAILPHLGYARPRGNVDRRPRRGLGRFAAKTYCGVLYEAFPGGHRR
jgi:hypothetical protein